MTSETRGTVPAMTDTPRAKAETCGVGLNTNDCEAPPGGGSRTRATCYRCGQTACRSCAPRRLAWTTEGPRRVRVCRDCQAQDGKP